MTLREYITILKKSVGDVSISTTVTNELNILSVEDKINIFDSKIIVSHASMSTVKYSIGSDDITIVSSIKVPKACKWAAILKLSLTGDESIQVNINIITVGEIDIDTIMDDKLNTFIKI